MVRRVGRRRLVLGLGALALGAAASFDGRAVVRAAPGREDDEAVRESAEATLTRLEQMRQAGDVSLLPEVLDPAALPLRRYLTEQVRTWERLGKQAPLPGISYRVRGVRPALGSFVKADLGLTYDGLGLAEATYVFREVDGRWLLSEPPEAQLGERRVRDTDHFRLRYYEWDEPLIEAMGRLYERAYAENAGRAGLDGFAPIDVRLYPTLQNPNLNNRAYAYYTDGAMIARSPECYGFGTYAPGRRDAGVVTIVRHEYGHHIVRQHLTETGAAGRPLKPWLNEGFAEWVAENFRPSTARRGLADRAPAEGVLDWVDKRLVNETTQLPEDVGLAYALSAYAVRYIVEHHGGLADGYWAFVDRLMATRDLDEAARARFGQPWAEFQADFRQWVEERV